MPRDSSRGSRLERPPSSSADLPRKEDGSIDFSRMTERQQMAFLMSGGTSTKGRARRRSRRREGVAERGDRRGVASHRRPRILAPPLLRLVVHPREEGPRRALGARRERRTAGRARKRRRRRVLGRPRPPLRSRQSRTKKAGPGRQGAGPQASHQTLGRTLKPPWRPRLGCPSGIFQARPPRFSAKTFAQSSEGI